jgi:protein-L-isoaspartate(D-aspartate) O-methyltransferase
MSLNVELARHNMVEQQVRPWEVLDSRVLEALTAIRREDFVRANYSNLAFADLPLPLAPGEFAVKPVVEAACFRAVAPTRRERRSKSAGVRFLTACLARFAASVHSLEQRRPRRRGTRPSARARTTNATIEIAEAVNGFTPPEQYDVMVVTGAVHAVPQRWREWVRPGGRLFAIIGESPVQRATLYTRGVDGQWSEDGLFETDVAYLTHEAPPRRFVL